MVTAMTTWSHTINHEFPIRPGMHAVLTLPDDMTQDEAERLVRYINALAVDTLTGEDSDD